MSRRPPASPQDAAYANGYDDGLEDGITYARRNDLPLGLTVETAIERGASVLATYRDKPQFVDMAVMALILDALDWPYGNGQRPSDMKPPVAPGHPVKDGAGYDCCCGECLALRTSQKGS